MASTRSNSPEPQLASAAMQGSARASWTHLFAFTRKSHMGLLVAALLATATMAGFKTALSIVLGRIFDVIADLGNGKVEAAGALSSISMWAVVLVGFGVGNWFASSAFLGLWIAYSELRAEAARIKVMDSFMKKDIAWFDTQSEGISSLLVRNQTQIRELQLATSQVLGLIISDIITSLASLGIALFYSWKLTLVLLATLPVSFVVLSLLTQGLEPAIQAQKRDLATASKYATSSIAAIDVVKVYNGHDQELWQYWQSAQSAARHYITQALCNAFQMGYVSFWVTSMFVLGFWYGVVLVNGGLPPGHVLTTFYATLAAFQGVEALMPQWLVIAKGFSAAASLSNLTSDVKKEAVVAPAFGFYKPRDFAGDIELNNVSFSYPSNPLRLVLRPSSFFFPAGDMTFIVGESGSGKSTLGNLIIGFYPPNTGNVQIDSLALSIFDTRWLRENVMLVQQTSAVFDDTFFNNVAFGHSNPQTVSTQDVLRACDMALLQSTIASLPQGLETNIGSGGHRLSGGQKQRLALARARLRDPPVLILDEITSGLDQTNSTLIMEAIRKWRRGKTTIIITHNDSHIEDDDFVYVMDQAALVEEGFKGELLCREKGLFARLANVSHQDVLYSNESHGAVPHEDVSPEEAPMPEIEITAASPIATSPTSPTDTLLPPRSSRLSQMLVGGLQINSPDAPGIRTSGRISLGMGPATALQLRTGHLRNSVYSYERPLSAASSAGWPSTKKPRPESRSAKMMTDSPDSSEDWTEEPHFVFGGTERRQGNVRRQHGQHNADVPLAEMGKAGSQQNDEPQHLMSLMTILKTVWPALKPRQRVVLIVGLATCVIGACSVPAFSYCFAQLLGVMWSPGDKLAQGRKWALYLVAIAVVDGVCTGSGHYLLERSGQAWVGELRYQAMRRILRQPRTWFDKPSHSPGRVNECLDRDAEELRNIVGRFVPIVISVVIMISAAVVWALIISWKLTLVSLAPLPLVMGAVKGFSAVAGKWETRCNKAAEEASAVLTDVFLNIRAVRALTLEGFFRGRYAGSVAHALDLGFERAKWTCGLFGLYQSLNYPMTALIFYYSTLLLTSRGHMTPTAVLQVVNLLLFSMGTATSILSTVPQITMAQATAAQLLSYSKLPPRPEVKGTKKKNLVTILPVDVRNLNFAYKTGGGHTVLRDVSFQIHAGDVVALVGPSGCGKSTMISLMLGLYSPASSWRRAFSPLSYGGISYADANVERVRSMTAYVPQSPLLFPATIAGNIAYGLGENSRLHSMRNIVAAAQAAGIHDFIVSLPDGYGTRVGDGGQALSGGQSQRICIARALCRQPQLLVLDEPTSALDAASAELIHQTIRGLAQRARPGGGSAARTAIVVVTHREEMMAVADRIVMLEEGTKVEEGTYADLLHGKGRLADLLLGGQRQKAPGPDGGARR